MKTPADKVAQEIADSLGPLDKADRIRAFAAALCLADILLARRVLRLASAKRNRIDRREWWGKP